MKFTLINRYIARNFLVKFLQITGGFSLLIFFINFIETLDKIKQSNGPFWVSILMSFLQIPDFLNDVAPSLVVISAIATFFILSSKSEISVIRMSGFSLWQILQPVAFSAFCLGIFWILVFGPISILMSKKYNALEVKYVKHEFRESMEPQNGIWLKQANVEKPDEEIIFQAKKIYKGTVEFANVTVWFFNKNGQFYKKIDAQEMQLANNSWVLEKVILNEGEIINKKVDSVSIKTNLQPDFVMQKIVNNFQNVKLFSIFELPQLITDLQSAGFSSRKFQVYFHSLLSKPLLFLAMTLIACYFGLNHIRNQNSILMIFFGTIIGLALYIISSIVNALGSSGLIPIFASTWVIAIVCLAIGTLLIYQKENL